MEPFSSTAPVLSRGSCLAHIVALVEVDMSKYYA